MPTIRRNSTAKQIKVTVDWGKLFVIGLLLTCATILTITNHLDDGVIAAILFATTGYVFGNGALALRGKQNSPTIRGEVMEEEI